MRKGSFANVGGWRSAPAEPGSGLAEPGAAALERQQATLLCALREARGAAVSFAELQSAGIEFPASVVSELELVEVPVRRCLLYAHGEHVVGVRLDPAWWQTRASGQRHAGERPSGRAVKRPLEGERLARSLRACRRVIAHLERLAEGLLTRAAAALWRALPRIGGAVRTGRDALAPVAGAVRAASGALSTRWLAPAALLAAAGAITALALAPLDGGGERPGRSRASSHAKGSISAGAHAASSASTPSAVRKPSPTPVSSSLAVELEARGHELLEAGEYAEAVGFLARAVAATGERLDDCLQPANETCLTYAYALYDLGHALALDGRPAAAVPVLERRLQIENQRPTVVAELERARAEAG